MAKVIRILEVPLLLLIIAMMSIENGLTGIPIFLITISILRLWVNVVTDNTLS